MAASAFRPVVVCRVEEGRRSTAQDRAATEEPLEIQIDGESFAVTMRTPGADLDLAMGFLFSERVIRSAAGIIGAEHCGDHRNVVNVSMAAETASERGPLLTRLTDRRRVMGTSSCGL